MVLYERYVDHLAPFTIARFVLAVLVLISALALDCINLSYF